MANNTPDDLDEFEEFLARVQDDPSLQKQLKGLGANEVAEVATKVGLGKAGRYITEKSIGVRELEMSTCTRNSRTNLTRGKCEL